ncbi:MAG TPA: exonuclease domain-containing protein [Adhaeribacter sp.]|nr:exonuclease domain-containing protein [Adhaeribacter sp.]
MKNISPYNRLIDSSTFTVLDFETANDALNSACSLSYIRVEKGEIKDQGYTLIKPKNARISETHRLSHGITEKDLEMAPGFKEVWKTLEPLLANQVVLPLNCASDIEVLIAMANDHDIALPQFRYICAPESMKADLIDLDKFNLKDISVYFDLQFDYYNTLAEDLIEKMHQVNAIGQMYNTRPRANARDLNRHFYRKRMME